MLRRLSALLGSLLAVGGARALDLPADSAEAMFHSYKRRRRERQRPGAAGAQEHRRPRLAVGLVLRRLGQQCVDRRRHPPASPYRERRNEYSFGADYVYRDSKITFGVNNSKEPDYTANRYSLDISQETFGGMTTVSLGFTRGSDQVGKHDAPEFSDIATHWQYPQPSA